LDIMYDNDAQLKLEALDELGIYRVDIRLPYRSKEKETAKNETKSPYHIKAKADKIVNAKMIKNSLFFLFL